MPTGVEMRTSGRATRVPNEITAHRILKPNFPNIYTILAARLACRIDDCLKSWIADNDFLRRPGSRWSSRSKKRLSSSSTSRDLPSEIRVKLPGPCNMKWRCHTVAMLIPLKAHYESIEVTSVRRCAVVQPACVGGQHCCVCVVKAFGTDWGVI